MARYSREALDKDAGRFANAPETPNDEPSMSQGEAEKEVKEKLDVKQGEQKKEGQ